MANEKIRLTYLWTDRDTMVMDFANNLSAAMTDWTERFFRRFEFDLVINPPDRSSVDRSSKFLLDKSDGVRPDFRVRREVVRDELEAMKRVEAQREPLMKRLLELQARVSSLLPRVTANPPDPDHARVSAQFDAAHNEFQRVHAIIERLDQEYDVADARKDAKLARADAYDYALRMRMMRKFLEDGVGTKTSLNVVFCRSQRFPLTTLRMRRGRILGIHSDPLPKLIIFHPLKMSLWPHSYLALDIEGNFGSTLAHEIIHAAGHDHPDDRIVKTGVEKYVKNLQLGGGSFGLPSRGPIWENLKLEYETVDVYEEMEGGYFDGPDTDIMNYNLKKEAKASDVSLQDRHKELLKNAIFVKTPPAP